MGRRTGDVDREGAAVAGWVSAGCRAGALDRRRVVAAGWVRPGCRAGVCAGWNPLAAKCHGSTVSAAV